MSYTVVNWNLTSFKSAANETHSYFIPKTAAEIRLIPLRMSGEGLGRKSLLNLPLIIIRLTYVVIFISYGCCCVFFAGRNIYSIVIDLGIINLKKINVGTILIRLIGAGDGSISS